MTDQPRQQTWTAPIFQEDQLLNILPALTAEGLLPALLALESLLASQLPQGEGRWRDIDTPELLEHLQAHIDELHHNGVQAEDDDTGHPTAAHVAARALMVLARAIEEM